MHPECSEAWKVNWPVRECTKCGKKDKHHVAGEYICDECDTVGSAVRAQISQERRINREIIDENVTMRIELHDVGTPGSSANKVYTSDRIPYLMQQALVPSSYMRYTRTSWESKYGKWIDVDDYLSILGWPPHAEEISESEWCVLMHGMPGSRKTSLATSLLVEAMCVGWRCMWIDAAEYVNSVRSLVSSGDTDGANVYRSRILNVGVLLIDELPYTRMNDWRSEELARVLKYRHRCSKPTIVTTNGNIDDLGNIDERLPSRVLAAIVITMDDKDYRISARNRHAGITESDDDRRFTADDLD
jgi:hypothetical protein